MQASRLVQWDDRLTRLTLAILIFAAAYGMAAGAVITMYYEVVRDIASVEDSLGPIQMMAYLLAVVLGFLQLVFAVWEIRHKNWRQALMRAVLGFAPLIIFLGTDGLLSHVLWWSPLSDTGRYHMLHHTLVAGVPLTLGYWLVLRAWRQPMMGTDSPPLTAKGALAAALVVVPVVLIAVLGIGVLFMGLLPLPILGVGAAVGVGMLIVLWWQSR